MRHLLNKTVWVAAAVSFFLLSQPQEARADYIIFTDPAAYNAALAQRGITEHGVRFNEPGTRQTGSNVSGLVGGLTLAGPTDLVATFSSFAPNLRTVTSPVPGVEGGPFDTLFIRVFSPGGSLSEFHSISGFITVAPGQSGNLSLSARAVFGDSATIFSLNVSSGGPVFFGVLSTGGRTIRQITLFSQTDIQMTGISQVGIGGAAAVPEPATVLLLGTGLAGAAGMYRRRRSRGGGAA